MDAPLPPDLRQRLAKVKAASLTDAMAKVHTHRAHVLDLVSPTPGRVLFGPAATLAFVPVRADVDQKTTASFDRLMQEAVGPAPAGKVIVMANYGPPAAAVAGGKRLATLERDGLAGLLTNGRLRDFDEVRAYSFVAYCAGETTFAGSREIMPVAANVPVSLGTATVLPGDYVYADASGAVVIPRADLVRVLHTALAIEEADAASVEAVLKAPRQA